MSIIDRIKLRIKKDKNKELLKNNIIKQNHPNKPQNEKIPKKNRKSDLVVQNKYKQIEKQIKQQVSQKTYPTSVAIRIMNSLLNKLNVTPHISRNDLVIIMYKAKYVSKYREPLPRLNGSSIGDSLFDDFNEATHQGRMLLLKGTLKHNKAEQKHGKKIVKVHEANPQTITRKAMIDNLKALISIEKDDIKAAIDFYLSKRIIVSQDNNRNIRTLSITPVTTEIKSYSSMAADMITDAINELKRDAINKHCNGIINIHIIKDDNDTDDIDNSGKVIADLVRIKNHPLLKEDYPTTKDKIELLKKLQKEYR